MLPDEYRDCSDFPNAHNTSPEKGKLGWGPRARLRVSSTPLNSITLYISSIRLNAMLNCADTSSWDSRLNRIASRSCSASAMATSLVRVLRTNTDPESSGADISDVLASLISWLHSLVRVLR